MIVPFGEALGPDELTANISFAFDHLISPQQQGSGSDRRLLGMGLFEIMIVTDGSSPNVG